MFNLIRWIFLCMLTVVVVTAQHAAPPRGDPNGPFGSGPYVNFDPTMTIVVMVLVGVFLFVGFISICNQHCNEANAIATAAGVAAASSGQSSRPKGLDASVIESFPVFVFSYVKDLKLGKGALECAVCLSEFEDDETLRLIPKCSHVFHPDCIDAWLASHVTCPVCRAKLTPDSNAKDKPVESCSNITELNSNNNDDDDDELSLPTTERVEEQNEFVIQVNEETRPRVKITGKFSRSHSTGHSLIQPGENVERFTLRLPEETRKQIAKSGRLKRTRSYDVVLRMEGSSRKGEEGSSRGKGNIDRWVLLTTPPFVSKTGSVKSHIGGGENSSWRGLTSVRDKLNCLNWTVELVEKEDSSARPPV